MSNCQPDWLLLDRFLAGECSPVEAEQVERWFDQHPESAAELGLLREVIDRHTPSESAPSVWDIERAWSRLKIAALDDVGARYRLSLPLRRVDGADAPAAQSNPVRFNVGRFLRPKSSRWLRAAAVLVLLGSGAGAVLWRWTSNDPSRAAGTTARVVATLRAERADLRLADGTRVILGPESRLTIPADFGATRRDLSLIGEGYFEAVHDSRKPFLVHAAHGVVHDLGTRFSVRAYPGDSTVEVVVAEGQVVAGLAGAALPLRGPVLGRGDLARLDTAGATILVRGVDVDRYHSWTEGRLRFAATPLRDALPQLTRWYDVDFVIADSAVGSRRLTATLRDQPLAQVISTIAQVTNTRYERTDRVVRFYAPPVTPHVPRAP